MRNVMPMGKYKGKKLDEILQMDKKYLVWMLRDLRDKHNPHSKFAAQNQQLIDDLNEVLRQALPGPTDSTFQPKTSPAVSQDLGTGLEPSIKALNLNIQTLILLLREINTKIKPLQDQGDTEIPF